MCRIDSYIEIVLVDILKLHRDGVLAGLFIVHIASSMGGKIGVAVLKVRDLIFSVVLLLARWNWILQDSRDDRYPSYSPTESWTKRRPSSGRSDGRRAVVRSKGWRNITRYHGSANPAIVMLRSQKL